MRRLVEKWGSKPGSIFESVALVSITLLLIGFYLYSSASVTVLWLLGWGVLAVICLILSLAASYAQVALNKDKEEQTEYRISYQLIETLKTKEMLPDVIFGLERLIQWHGKDSFKGQTEFLQELEKVFGSERLKEVETTLLKYARVPRTSESSAKSSDSAAPLPASPSGTVSQSADNGAHAPATLTFHG